MIEIAGLVVRERIAKTEFLDVFRCVRRSDNRSLVLKVQREDYPADAQTVAALAAHSKLHALVQHPNVVPLFHHGVKDGLFYCLEEYISGPDLREQLTSGVLLPTLIDQLVGIARGLNAVHHAGFIHGDVKPEHIKVPDNGIAQLVDFGNAALFGSILKRGTPGYISPEQMSGERLDKTSDLFSLGVVLFHALAGSLPFSSEATQENFPFERVPRLPDHFAALQPVIDRALSRRSDDRYASGEAFADALISAAKPLASNTQLPRIRSAAIATNEIRNLSSVMLTTSIDTNRKEGRTRQENRGRTRRNVFAAALVLVSLAGVGYYIDQSNQITVDEILSTLGIVEDPLLVSAWNEAQSLSGDSNQDLAAIAAAHRRVLALAPDHPGARDALVNLESVWKTSVEEALLQGNLEAVATRLAEAQTVFPDDVEWVNLRTQLLNRQRAERIVNSTALLLTSHGLSDLPSATAAIQSYQEVLRLAPGHDGARKALTELGEHYAQLAVSAVTQGNLNDGISLLERATAADNSVPRLDDVRKLISQATTAAAAIDDLLQQARRLRSENQLMLPPGENAAELYHRVLATDPKNAIASQGLVEITSQVAARAEALLLAGQLGDVDILVSQAQAASLVPEGVAEIRRRLDAERLRQQTIEENLQLARSLIVQGFLTLPNDNNAIAKLREVQQVDPGNAAATGLLQQCAQRLAAVALEAHEFELIDEAKQYLDLALAITPDVGSWVALRESWEDDE